MLFCNYYLDTGKKLPYTTRLYLGDLIDNRESLINWNGPYISAEPANEGNTIDLLAKISGYNWRFFIKIIYVV